MGKALYRKYRSKKLSEIVGQEHVTTALDNSLKSGRIGHAYLFTGPRGTGKTSIARILAHEVNGLPYDENTSHLDIIEIDAASNRRIDEIRTLRERVHNAPTSAKYKVYIIDEVHMLTKEAFNALLKTLEEPPEHVIFILATTEAHKLPETIISRTQRYTFKPAEKSAAASLLKSIATSEGIDISDEAVTLVAEHGRGSFRDSVSILDQVSNSGDKITLDDVRRSLGIAPEESIRALISTLANGTPADLLHQLHELHTQGHQAPQIAKQLGGALREDMLANHLQLAAQDATLLMQRLIDIPAAHDPISLLEIVLLDIVLKRNGPQTAVPTKVAPAVAVAKPSVKKDPKPTASEIPSQEPVPAQTKPVEHKKDPTPETAPAPKPPTPATTIGETEWHQILQALKQSHNTLYGVARMAVPLFADGKLTLCFSFPFHQKRMNDAKNRQIISDIAARELGTTFEITCIVDKNATPAPVPSEPASPTTEAPQPKQNSAVDTISTIFGGGEILE